MLTRASDHLLQGRQLIVEIAGLLIKEGEPAPDIEVIGKFRRRFLKKIGCSLRTPFNLLERNAPRLLSRLLIRQRNVTWTGLLRRNVRLTLVKINICARDPRVGIISRLLPPFG